MQSDLGSRARCHACFERLQLDGEQAPYVISCGHIFCVGDPCVRLLATQRSATEAVPQQSQQSTYGLPQDHYESSVEVGGNSEGHRLRQSISIVDERTPVFRIRQLHDNGKAFLAMQPRNQFQDLETNINLLGCLIDAKETLLIQNQFVDSLTDRMRKDSLEFQEQQYQMVASVPELLSRIPEYALVADEVIQFRREINETRFKVDVLRNEARERNETRPSISTLVSVDSGPESPSSATLDNSEPYSSVMEDLIDMDSSSNDFKFRAVSANSDVDKGSNNNDITQFESVSALRRTGYVSSSSQDDETSGSQASWYDTALSDSSTRSCSPDETMSASISCLSLLRTPTCIGIDILHDSSPPPSASSEDSLALPSPLIMPCLDPPGPVKSSSVDVMRSEIREVTRIRFDPNMLPQRLMDDIRSCLMEVVARVFVHLVADVPTLSSLPPIPHSGPGIRGATFVNTANDNEMMDESSLESVSRSDVTSHVLLKASRCLVISDPRDAKEVQATTATQRRELTEALMTTEIYPGWAEHVLTVGLRNQRIKIRQAFPYSRLQISDHSLPSPPLTCLSQQRSTLWMSSPSALTPTFQRKDITGNSSPASDLLYDILPTSYGRGAFAHSHISKDNLVLSCAGPYANVIFRKFRREVCAWCFAYAFESGKRKWNIKVEEDDRNGAGAWFCSQECRLSWIGDYKTAGDDVGWWMDIHAALERHVTQFGRRRKASPENSPGRRLDFLEKLLVGEVTQEVVDQAWSIAQGVSSEETKPGARTEWADELNEIELDTVRFVLDGLIRKVVEDSKLSCIDPTLAASHKGAGRWADFLGLQDNDLLLARSKPYLLVSHIRNYRFIRHFITTLTSHSQSRHTHPSKESLMDGGQDLPADTHPLDRLRAYVSTPTLVRAILGRDHGNVFGIWDTATDDQGSEMLGWGAYVFGSYFNHDCNPNIMKRRVKRGIEFYTIRDINPGEELCIAYVDEIAPAHERNEQLHRDFFFICQCAKCSREQQAVSTVGPLSTSP
ncbi:hypothetical protein B0H34DRAFT_676312 [Crassisporium funariophilum]|nr:hypothetical protein B0H34DRAFT_676312 [Crassisporium funariophilum]